MVSSLQPVDLSDPTRNTKIPSGIACQITQVPLPQQGAIEQTIEDDTSTNSHLLYIYIIAI